jgi:hypothetical protein
MHFLRKKFSKKICGTKISRTEHNAFFTEKIQRTNLRNKNSSRGTQCFFLRKKNSANEFAERKFRARNSMIFLQKKFSERICWTKNFRTELNDFFAEKIQRTEFAEQKILRTEHNVFFAEKIQQ